MSVQEIKQRIHHLVDKADDEASLGQVLEMANELLTNLSGQVATLDELTIEQRNRLDQAIDEHRLGKTVSNEDMKQRYRQWLTE